ncbi:MAG: proteinase inhibitor I4 serpin [Flavobacteriales bacterium]|nr:proteinase inhibitor I4 serpin [Flavobacteriales bacterium]
MKRSLTYSILFLALFLISCDKECNVEGDCALIPDPGPCEAAFPKYYFDQDSGTCKEFLWGGCDGVVPFDTLEECRECKCQ